MADLAETGHTRGTFLYELRNRLCLVFCLYLESRICSTVSQNSETLSRILEMASVWKDGICPEDGNPPPPRQAEI